MRITIVPASPKTGIATIRALLASPLPPETIIHAVYRDPSRAPSEFTDRPEFLPVKGDMETPGGLAGVDIGAADAVLMITPPGMGCADPVGRAEGMARRVRDEVEREGSGVRKVVVLSSVGAQYENGVGEIKTNHVTEQVFSSTGGGPALVFVRCTYFMENWITLQQRGLRDVDKQRGPVISSTIAPADHKIPMVAVADVGAVLAHELLRDAGRPPGSQSYASTQEPEPSSSPSSQLCLPSDESPHSSIRTNPLIFELHGPRDYSPNDVRCAMSRALGRDVQLRCVPRDELRKHLRLEGLIPVEQLDLWVEMATSLLPGGKLAPGREDTDGRPVVRGGTGLEEALRAGVGGNG